VDALLGRTLWLTRAQGRSFSPSLHSTGCTWVFQPPGGLAVGVIVARMRQDKEQVGMIVPLPPGELRDEGGRHRHQSTESWGLQRPCGAMGVGVCAADMERQTTWSGRRGCSPAKRFLELHQRTKEARGRSGARLFYEFLSASQDSGTRGLDAATHRGATSSVRFRVLALGVFLGGER